jgi:hypothetical protein
VLSARDPAGDVADAARQRSGADPGPGADMREVWAEAVFCQSAYRVATAATETEEESPSLLSTARQIAGVDVSANCRFSVVHRRAEQALGQPIGWSSSAAGFRYSPFAIQTYDTVYTDGESNGEGN